METRHTKLSNIRGNDAQNPVSPDEILTAQQICQFAQEVPAPVAISKQQPLICTLNVQLDTDDLVWNTSYTSFLPSFDPFSLKITILAPKSSLRLIIY